MKKSLKIAIGAAFLALAGCATTPVEPLSSRDVLLLQDTMRDLAQKEAAAEFIADNCRRYRATSSVRSAVYANPEMVALAERGVTRQQVDAAIRTPEFAAEIQQGMLDYIAKRDIVVLIPESFCKAGDYEKRNNTAIGSLLIAR